MVDGGGWGEVDGLRRTDVLDASVRTDGRPGPAGGAEGRSADGTPDGDARVFYKQ